MHREEDADDKDGSDVIGGTANDETEARAQVGKIVQDDDDRDCCAAASDGRLRRASRFRERVAEFIGVCWWLLHASCRLLQKKMRNERL